MSGKCKNRWLCRSKLEFRRKNEKHSAKMRFENQQLKMKSERKLYNWR